MAGAVIVSSAGTDAGLPAGGRERGLKTCAIDVIAAAGLRARSGQSVGTAPEGGLGKNVGRHCHRADAGGHSCVRGEAGVT